MPRSTKSTRSTMSRVKNFSRQSLTQPPAQPLKETVVNYRTASSTQPKSVEIELTNFPSKNKGGRRKSRSKRHKKQTKRRPKSSLFSIF